MAYLGLLGPAAALGSFGQMNREGTWAADEFLRCCRASDGAWRAPAGQGDGTMGQRGSWRSRSPPLPRVKLESRGGVLDARPPRWPTPQVAMTQGRRATEGEVPTTIWMDPPNQEEVQVLLVVLQAIRTGEFAPECLPGAASRGSLRIRGVDAPPRQGCVTRCPRPLTL